MLLNTSKPYQVYNLTLNAIKLSYIEVEIFHIYRLDFHISLQVNNAMGCGNSKMSEASTFHYLQDSIPTRNYAEGEERVKSFP